jgi:hypothetical protein
MQQWLQRQSLANISAGALCKTGTISKVGDLKKIQVVGKCNQD